MDFIGFILLRVHCDADGFDCPICLATLKAVTSTKGQVLKGCVLCISGRSTLAQWKFGSKLNDDESKEGKTKQNPHSSIVLGTLNFQLEFLIGLA